MNELILFISFFFFLQDLQQGTSTVVILQKNISMLNSLVHNQYICTHIHAHIFDYLYK